MSVAQCNKGNEGSRETREVSQEQLGIRGKTCLTKGWSGTNERRCYGEPSPGLGKTREGRAITYNEGCRARASTENNAQQGGDACVAKREQKAAL